MLSNHNEIQNPRRWNVTVAEEKYAYNQRAAVNNKHKITLVSFLAYFVMSGMLAPIGIISGPMAEYFDVPITEVTANFSFLTFGLLGGAIFALFVFERVELKNVMIATFGVIAVCLLSLNLHDNESLLWLSIGVVGFFCGTGLAGGALVITRTYEGRKRASMLVITDSFFSIAGFICSSIAVFFIAREFHWTATYQVVAAVALGVFVLSLLSQFPKTISNSSAEPAEQSGASVMLAEQWSIGVWLCVAALFLYTLGQNSLLLWLPNYAETQLAVPRDTAGRVVSQFWLGMFVAQLSVAVIVTRLGTKRLVRIAAITALIFSIPMWMNKSSSGLLLFATLWGFGNLAILKLIISFATQLVRIPTGRLVSTLLLGGTLGTSVSAWLSSEIVSATNNHVILQFGTFCYLIMAVLMWIATTYSAPASDSS